MSRVGLVVVSHSARLAEGVVELAGQMAPDVVVLPAGGLPDGGLGTDHDAVVRAVERADQGAGVVLLYDLGSAQMTAELVVESLDDPARSRARVVDAPLVEGAVAAAVAAQGGADLDGVARAAEAAGAPAGPVPAASTSACVADGPATPVGARVGAGAGAVGQDAVASPERAAPAEPMGPIERAEVVLTNEIGLHARPAALLARAIAGLDARVTVRHGDHEASGHSVLALMALDARRGDRIEVTATGPDAQNALRRITDLAARRFE